MRGIFANPVGNVQTKIKCGSMILVSSFRLNMSQVLSLIFATLPILLSGARRRYFAISVRCL